MHLERKDRISLHRAFIAFIILVSHFPYAGLAQSPVNMNFTVDGGGGKWYYLYRHYAGQMELADSALAYVEGGVEFSRQAGYVPGMYRLQNKNGQGIDFLAEGESVVMEVGLQLDRKSARMVAPSSGQVLFDYLEAKERHGKRMDLLVPLIMDYPERDTFYSVAVREAQRIDGEFGDYVEKTLEQQAASLAGRIIRFDLLEEIVPGKVSPQRKEFLRQHYFDGVNMADTFLLRTPILPGKVVSYLSLYVVPGQGKEAQEKAFIQAADSLMRFTAGSPVMQAAVANYLISGFEAYGFESVIRHLVENYLLKNTCVSEEESSVLSLRMEGFRNLAPGNSAPDFTANDANGNLFRLSEAKSPNRLLFFWSSECPHCKQAMPGLKSIEKEFKGELQIIGISVDTDETSWREAIRENGLYWPNIAELNGWDGPIVKSYYIYATPTFFLVDQGMKIVAKPLSVGEIREFIEGH